MVQHTKLFWGLLVKYVGNIMSFSQACSLFRHFCLPCFGRSCLLIEGFQGEWHWLTEAWLLWPFLSLPGLLANPYISTSPGVCTHTSWLPRSRICLLKIGTSFHWQALFGIWTKLLEERTLKISQHKINLLNYVGRKYEFESIACHFYDLSLFLMQPVCSVGMDLIQRSPCLSLSRDC